MASESAFGQHLQALAAMYEAVVQENAQLRAQIAALERAEQPPGPSTPRTPLSAKVKVQWTPVPREFPDAVLSVAYGAGRYAFGLASGEVVVFDRDLGADAVPIVYRGQRGAINAVAINDTSMMMASFSGDRTVHVWSGAGVVQARLAKHNAPVTCGGWVGPDKVVSGSEDRMVYVWDVARNATHEIVMPAAVVALDCRDPVFVVAQGAEARLVDQRAPGNAATFSHGKGQLVAVRFADADTVVTAATDRTVRVWDVRAQEARQTWDVDHVASALAAEPHVVFVPTETGRSRVIQLPGGPCQTLSKDPFAYAVSCAAFVGERKVIVGSWDGTAAIGDLL